MLARKRRAIEVDSRLATDAGNGRQTNHRYRGVVEDPVLEIHQLHAVPQTLGDLALELNAAKFQVLSGRCAYVSWKGLACPLVETDRVVQKEFSEAARGKPRKAAVVSQAPEGEAPITIETVPSEKRRLRRDTGHRLDGIPHQFANMPEFIHHAAYRMGRYRESHTGQSASRGGTRGIDPLYQLVMRHTPRRRESREHLGTARGCRSNNRSSSVITAYSELSIARTTTPRARLARTVRLEVPIDGLYNASRQAKHLHAGHGRLRITNAMQFLRESAGALDVPAAPR